MAKSYTKLIRGEGWLAPPLAGLLVVVSALVVRFALSPLPGYDVRDYRLWAELVARDGATAIYHADIFIPYNYPPVFLYILDPIGGLYAMFSPSFDTTSLLLGVLLRTPTIFADAAIALSIYLFLVKRAPPRSALVGALTYALNPAIIWDTGYWGGIDAIHTLLAFLSVLLLLRRLPEASWSLLTLSILTKPIGAPIAIIVAFLTIVHFGLKRAALSGAAAAATAFAAITPFLVAGTFGEMWTALVGNLGNYNNISANAHNLWWLVSGGYGWTKDTDLFLGVASYRAIGLALFAFLALWCLFMLQRRPQESHIFCVGAFLTFAFYMLPTEVHENWVFGALPFLAVACVLEPRFRPALVVLTITFWLNMALHELYFGYELPEGWLGYFLATARMANSVANSVLLLYWAWSLLRLFRADEMISAIASHPDNRRPT